MLYARVMVNKSRKGGQRIEKKNLPKSKTADKEKINDSVAHMGACERKSCKRYALVNALNM